MILPSLHQPWLNVCLRHSSTALAVEFIVGVDPFAVVYASFNPASSSRRRICTIPAIKTSFRSSDSIFLDPDLRPLLDHVDVLL